MVALMNLTDVAYLLYPTIPLRILFSLARAHGRLLYLTRRTVRDAVRKNLRDAVETSGVVGDVEEMTRRFFEYTQLRTLLLTLAHRLPDGERARLFPIEGEELFPTPDNAYQVCWYRFGYNQLMLVRGRLPQACAELDAQLQRRRDDTLGPGQPEPRATRRSTNRVAGKPRDAVVPDR